MTSKRQPLSRERVLTTALSIVDDEGLDALTMRRLGVALKVEAMSLYRHVDNRSALLDGIHETILGELGDPVPAKTKTKWTDAVRVYAKAFRRVLIAHPNAIVLFATRPAVTAGSLRHVDRSLSVLRGAGFSVEDAVSAMQTIVTFIVGHVLSTHAVTSSGDEKPTPDYASMADSLPSLAEAIDVLIDHGVDEEFDFGLDVVVRGLQSKLGEA